MFELKLSAREPGSFPISIQPRVPRDCKQPRQCRIPGTISGPRFVNTQPRLLKHILRVVIRIALTHEVSQKNRRDNMDKRRRGRGVAVLVGQQQVVDVLISRVGLFCCLCQLPQTLPQRAVSPAALWDIPESVLTERNIPPGWSENPVIVPVPPFNEYRKTS